MFRDLFKDEDGSVSYLWFKDNWHQHPWLSKLMCYLGRHDFELSEIIYDEQNGGIIGATLVCFYCEHYKNRPAPPRRVGAMPMQPRKPRTVAEVRDLLRSKGGLETSALAVSPAQVLSDRLRSLGIVPGQRPPVNVTLDTLRLFPNFMNLKA